MHFLYALVNFLILGLGLWLVGRRSVLPRFAQRRKDISKALDEAEALEAAALEEQPETETKKEPDALPEEPEDLSGTDALPAEDPDPEPVEIELMGDVAYFPDEAANG